MGGYGDAIILADQDKLDQEAAQNAATAQAGPSHVAVSGFKKPSLSIKGFPTHATGGSGFSVDASQVKTVATKMGGDVNTLNSGLNQLDGEGPMAQLIAAGWDTSNALGANAGNAWNAISTFMQDLHNTYNQMTNTMHKTASNYAEADDASATAVTNVGNQAAS
jgi:uncharacterized protein YukE